MANPSIIETISTENVDEFLEKISKNNPMWRKDSDKENFWVYRGQWEGSGEKQLIPSGLRPKAYNNIIPEIKNIRPDIYGINTKTIDNIINNVYTEIKKKDKKNLKEIATRSLTEFSVINEFIKTCNKSSLFLEETELKIMMENETINIEKVISCLSEKMKMWYDDCTSMEKLHRVMSYPPFFDYTNYYTVALAQHYGIPTRLLDWSYSPLIAAFFALPQFSKKHNQGKICVYGFNTQFQRNPFIDKNCLKIHSKIKHNRFEFLHVQKGVFIEMRGADFYYLRYGKWPSLDEHILEYDENAKSKYNLKKIVLDGKHAAELKDTLAIEDISKPTLMPTYFHCADYIMQR